MNSFHLHRQRKKNPSFLFIVFLPYAAEIIFDLRSSSRGFFFQCTLLWKHEKPRCLLIMMQISEVVNSMKDLIDYSRETGTGPMGKLIFYVVDSSYASIVYRYECES